MVDVLAAAELVLLLEVLVDEEEAEDDPADGGTLANEILPQLAGQRPCRARRAPCICAQEQPQSDKCICDRYSSRRRRIHAYEVAACMLHFAAEGHLLSRINIALHCQLAGASVCLVSKL